MRKVRFRRALGIGFAALFLMAGVLAWAAPAYGFVIAQLSLTKSTTSTGYTAAGDTIDYNYLVTNTTVGGPSQESSASDVAVSDNLVPDVSCPASTLAQGASETCTGTYTVTQADVNAGSVTNTATATATINSGMVTSNSSSVTVYLVSQTTTTSIAASANPVQIYTPVTYTATVTPAPSGGTVSFTDNGAAIAGCQALAVASASCSQTYPYYDAGANNIVATYSGVAGYDSSTSPTFSEIVTFNRCATLAGCNLQGLDLAGASLPGADLNGSNLQGASLQGADLAGAILRGANGQSANFTDVNLAGADLSGSNLNSANFTGANLADADFNGANLQNANFTDANLTGAITTGANLQGATWSNTTCPDGTNSDSDGGTCQNDLA